MTFDDLFGFPGMGDLFGHTPAHDFTSHAADGNDDNYQHPLIGEINELIRNQDKQALDNLVFDRNYEVAEEGDEELFIAHALGGIYADTPRSLELAIGSINQTEITRKEEIFGLIDFQLGRYESAIAHFDNAQELTTISNTIYAISLYQVNKGDYVNSLRRLMPFTDKSALAATVAGILLFNKGDYATALTYFEKAASISPKDFNAQMNVARAQYAICGETAGFFQVLGAIHMASGIIIDHVLYASELKKRELNVPKQLSNLYDIAKKIISRS